VSWIARTPLQQLPRRPSVDESHYHDWIASIPTPYHQTTTAAVTARAGWLASQHLIIKPLQLL